MGKKTKIDIVTLGLAATSIIVALIIYKLFRSHDIRMVSMLDAVFPADSSMMITEWAKYSLPDGLWLFSYELFIAWLWRYQIRLGSILFAAILPLVAIAAEFLQLTHFLPGTFDIVDVAFYLAACCFGILYSIYNHCLYYEKDISFHSIRISHSARCLSYRRSGKPIVQQ